jgi:hypothetical protein
MKHRNTTRPQLKTNIPLSEQLYKARIKEIIFWVLTRGCSEVKMRHWKEYGRACGIQLVCIDKGPTILDGLEEIEKQRPKSNNIASVILDNDCHFPSNIFYQDNVRSLLPFSRRKIVESEVKENLLEDFDRGFRKCEALTYGSQLQTGDKPEKGIIRAEISGGIRIIRGKLGWILPDTFKRQALSQSPNPQWDEWISYYFEQQGMQIGKIMYREWIYKVKPGAYLKESVPPIGINYTLHRGRNNNWTRRLLPSYNPPIEQDLSCEEREI